MSDETVRELLTRVESFLAIVGDVPPTTATDAREVLRARILTLVERDLIETFRQTNRRLYMLARAEDAYEGATSDEDGYSSDDSAVVAIAARIKLSCAYQEGQ